jgi:hypothetical protein
MNDTAAERPTESEQSPLYRAVECVDWPKGAGRVYLEPGDSPVEIPQRFAKWMLRCGAIEEVKPDGNR